MHFLVTYIHKIEENVKVLVPFTGNSKIANPMNYLLLVVVFNKTIPVFSSLRNLRKCSFLSQSD